MSAKSFVVLAAGSVTVDVSAKSFVVLAAGSVTVDVSAKNFEAFTPVLIAILRLRSQIEL